LNQEQYGKNLIKAYAKRLLLTILPQCKTLLGECYLKTDLLKEVIEANEKFEFPFIRDFRGESPLHKTLNTKR
jgi:hypothetical protein